MSVDKIDLYTCIHGYELMKMNLDFCAWEENSNSYDNVQELGRENIKISVPLSKVEKISENYYTVDEQSGGYLYND